MIRNYFFFGISDLDLARDFLFSLVSSSGGLLADLLGGHVVGEGFAFDLAIKLLASVLL